MCLGLSGEAGGAFSSIGIEAGEGLYTVGSTVGGDIGLKSGEVALDQNWCLPC